MKKYFLFLVISIFIFNPASRANSAPCSNWSESDYREDIKSSWPMSLWEKRDGSADQFGNTYSNRVPSDVTDQTEINKIIENYRLNTEGLSCKNLLIQEGKISFHSILNQYAQNLYKVRGCESIYQPRESADAKAKLDPWSDPDSYLRMAFSNSLFDRSNGEFLYEPSGICATGSHCLDSVLMRMGGASASANYQRVSFESPYFMGFCGRLDELEKGFVELKSTLKSQHTD